MHFVVGNSYPRPKKPGWPWVWNRPLVVPAVGWASSLYEPELGLNPGRRQSGPGSPLYSSLNQVDERSDHLQAKSAIANHRVRIRIRSCVALVPQARRPLHSYVCLPLWWRQHSCEVQSRHSIFVSVVCCCMPLCVHAAFRSSLASFRHRLLGQKSRDPIREHDGAQWSVDKQKKTLKGQRPEARGQRPEARGQRL